MFKRIVALLLVFVTVAGFIPSFTDVGMTAFAAVSSGSCGDNVSWSLDSSGKLTISGSGELDYSYPWREEGIAAKVKSVYISKGVEYYDVENIFSECTQLTEITVDSSNKMLYSENGVLYGKYDDETTLISYPAAKTSASFVIPDAVTSIGMYAFSGCSKVKEITVSENITYAGSCAFDRCGVETIYWNAAYCSDAGGVGSDMFGDSESLKTNTKLKKVVIGPNVVMIPNDFMTGVTTLETVKWSDSVIYVGSNALLGTKWARNLFKSSSYGMIYLGNIAFAYKDSGKKETVKIKDGTKGIAGSAFQCYLTLFDYDKEDYVDIDVISDFSVKDLKRVVVPSSVISIGRSGYGINPLFYDWAAQQKGEYVKLGSTLVRYNGKVGKEWKIPEGIKGIVGFGIHDEEFYATTSKMDIYLPDSIEFIDGAIFDYVKYDSKTDDFLAVDVTLHGKLNSYAEKYVDMHGYNFKGSLALKDNSTGITINADEKSGIPSGTKLSVKDVTATVSYEIKEAAAKIGRKYTIYDITLTNGGNAVQPKNDVTLKIPLTPGYNSETSSIYYIDQGGKFTKIKSVYDGSCLSISTDHFSCYAIIDNSKITRLAGAGRCETAVAISKASFEKAANVVIASGDDYADALAGVPLAYALDAPILLIRNHTLDDATLGEIKRLGAKNVYILGGEFAVNAKVAKTLTGKGYEVTRLAGSDRFGTSLEIAKKLQSVAGKPSEIIFVYSHNYPDALAVSGVAAAKNCPVIYIAGTGKLTDGIASFVKSSGAKNATIISGPAIVNSAAEKNIKKAGASDVNRIYGANRYETCIKINEAYASVLTGKAVCVATGTNYPDALAGGVFAATKKAPLVLVDKSLADTQTKYLKSKSTDDVYVFGGTGVVSDKLASEVSKY